ncbi:MAG: GTPase Era, partial [Commensalibacter sp.]|nr:GTPase Era [Commensalibacter sp.]
MRCGFVALVGAPNAGKSTLLNRMVGAKLSIVSPKAQTTRMRILGIVMQNQTQILLMDTPGIFKPKRKLDEAMVASAWLGAAEADITALLIDVSSGLTDETLKIIEKLKENPKRIWLILNKIDKIPAQKLLPLTEKIANILPFEESFMISARTGDGVTDLLNQLAEKLP